MICQINVSVISFLHKLELICLPAIVSTQLNSLDYYCLTLIILFNMNYFFNHLLIIYYKYYYLALIIQFNTIHSFTHSKMFPSILI